MIPFVLNTYIDIFCVYIVFCMLFVLATQLEHQSVDQLEHRDDEMSSMLRTRAAWSAAAVAGAAKRMRWQRALSTATTAPHDNNQKRLAPAELGPYLNDNLEHFTPDIVRNFSIVAHIDHGKSVRPLVSLLVLAAVAASDALVVTALTLSLLRHRRSQTVCSRSAATSRSATATMRSTWTTSRSARSLCLCLSSTPTHVHSQSLSHRRLQTGRARARDHCEGADRVDGPL